MHNHIKITTKIWNNHNSEPSKIELNGSLKTKELKKPHPLKLVGGVQMWNGLVSHPCVVDKFGRDISEAKSPSHTSGPPAQGSSARKISPHNFWLQKLVGFESVEETSGAPSCSP